MTHPDPYSPPKASFPGVAAGGRVPVRAMALIREVFVVLACMHLIGTLQEGWFFLMLVQARSLNPLVLLLLVGSGCALYLGIWRWSKRGEADRWLFVWGGAGIVLVEFVFRPLSPGWLLGLLGAGLGAVGFWLARQGRMVAGHDSASDAPRINQARPLMIYLIVGISLVSFVGIIWYHYDNWFESVATFQKYPLTMVRISLSPLLLLVAVCLLFFLKKRAITVFAMYLFLSLYKTYDLANLVSWLDFLFIVAILAYCIRLWQRRILD